MRVLVSVRQILSASTPLEAMGARGLDMVPHIGFWREYPDLVADGIRYTIMMFNEFVGSSGGGSSRGGFKRFEGDHGSLGVNFY